jgi:hypothetical protein
LNFFLLKLKNTQQQPEIILSTCNNIHIKTNNFLNPMKFLHQ